MRRSRISGDFDAARFTCTNIKSASAKTLAGKNVICGSPYPICYTISWFLLYQDVVYNSNTINGYLELRIMIKDIIVTFG